MAKNRNMASPCGGPAIANVNHNSAQTTLLSIVAHYNQNGYRQLRIDQQMYTFNDLKGLLMGYTPFIMNSNGCVIKLWCCGVLPANLSIANVITPYTCPCTHQWWMLHNHTFVDRALKILAGTGFVGFTGSFEDLYDYVESLGITKGRLLLYDLTRRIGACLGIYPKDFVYLQWGSLAGATILHNKGYITLPNPCGFRVPTSVFASVFPGIDSMDIENILCIHKKQLVKLP